MNNNIKRLVIFCLLSFVPLCILMPIVNNVIGEKLFVSENYPLINLVGTLVMLFPATANILTRLITKEGFENTYLCLNMKGNFKYYLASVAVKTVEGFAGLFVIWKIFLPEFCLRDIFANVGEGTSTLLLQLAFSVILFMPAFGEEWGWRGYMMPKLTELTGQPAAVLVGGIIWGLWHAPLTVSGHNFGVDYAGFPFLGIGFMCLYCVCVNAFLTLLTERTGSILPASFAHMINNNLSAAFLLSVYAGEGAVNKFMEIPSIKFFAVYLSIVFITGVVSFILLMKYGADGKKLS